MRILTRRQFLARAGAVAGAAVAPAMFYGSPASAEDLDYTARSTFDYYDREFRASGLIGQATDTNEHGGLAWGQAYVLLSYVRMYEKYGDTYYLDRLVENFEAVLDNRDSVRGVTDYRGLSLPAWRATNPYTVGVVDLPDAAGNTVLRVRTAKPYADTATATVTAGAVEGRFTLTVANGQYHTVDTFSDLTLDPADVDYAPRRVYNAYPGRILVTVADRRQDPVAGVVPVAGQWAVSSQPVIFAVHTGQITYPVAMFCRIVRRDPRLHQRYNAVAARFVQAIRNAVAVHDREWEDDGDKGWLRWAKGTALPDDGVIIPLNQALILGATYAELSTLTDEDPSYARRARLLARGFRQSITIDAGGAALWPYWPVFSEMYRGFAKTGSPATDISEYTPSNGAARQYEDMSHAALSLEFATTAYRHGIEMTSDDLAPMAKTFTQNIARYRADGTPYSAWTLNGGGDAGANSPLVPRWMPVEPWDHAVFTHSLEIFRLAPAQPVTGWSLVTVAYLNVGQ